MLRKLKDKLHKVREKTLEKILEKVKASSDERDKQKRNKQFKVMQDCVKKQLLVSGNNIRGQGKTAACLIEVIEDRAPVLVVHSYSRMLQLQKEYPIVRDRIACMSNDEGLQYTDKLRGYRNVLVDEVTPEHIKKLRELGLEPYGFVNL